MEPMRPGWARKAGTPSTLLTATQSPGATTSLIPLPFTSPVTGSISQTDAPGSGQTTVKLDAALTAIPGARLRVVIHGAPIAGGGVTMQSGSARLGYAGALNLYRGTITSLDGTRVVASVHTSSGSAAVLAMDFSVDASSNAVTGTVSGQSGSGTR